MTESEFRRLPKAERQAMPTDELMGIILKTHDELTETLALEGWEYVAPQPCTLEFRETNGWRVAATCSAEAARRFLARCRDPSRWRIR